MISLESLPIETNTQKSFWKGFSSGIGLVFISGFGDKTFFLNMLYVSNTSFWEAFFVSLTVSELMNIISVFLGKVIPMFISRELLDWAAILLFLFFGIGMLIQGLTMKSVTLNEEMQIEKEEESKQPLVELSKDKIEQEQIKKKEDNELKVFNTWWKYSIAYMVGELGDKSQLATIVVTAKHNFYGVFIGTSMAQLLLVFSSMVIGKSISGFLTNRQISLIGGTVFLMFALFYLIEKAFGIDV